MDRAKIFKNGSSQAVRLPKEYRFKDDEVYVKHMNDAVLLIPRKSLWKSWFENLQSFTDDFPDDRRQPENQKREIL